MTQNEYAGQLGKRIHEARTAADLTQEQLAKLLGTNEQSIYRWETGKNEMAARWLPAIAEVTGSDPGWLLTGDLHPRGSAARIRHAAKALESVADVLKDLLDRER